MLNVQNARAAFISIQHVPADTGAPRSRPPPRRKRQRGHPSHGAPRASNSMSLSCSRRPATVDIPGLGIERILAIDGIEHLILCDYLFEHVGVGQRAHELNNADRIRAPSCRPASYSVSSDVKEILDRASSSARTCPSIRCHIDRHGTPLLALRLNAPQLKLQKLNLSITHCTPLQ